jgi:hypothetical protein
MDCSTSSKSGSTPADSIAAATACARGCALRLSLRRVPRLFQQRRQAAAAAEAGEKEALFLPEFYLIDGESSLLIIY